MKKNEPVSHIMSTQLVHASEDTKISEVKLMMEEHHINHIPVLTNGKIIGLVSKTDILRSSFSNVFVQDDAGSEAQLDSVAALSDIMATDIKTVLPTTTVREVAMELLGASYSSLPVIDENEKLVGIVTTKDIIRYLVEQY